MLLREQIEFDTRELSLEHGRRVRQSGHEAALRFLRGRLDEIGLEFFKESSFDLTYERPHPDDRQTTTFTNLIGRIPGRDSTLKPLLIGAHYDSVIDAPCSDDNATAVAVTLAAAQTIREEPLARDTIIAIFDAEEPPFFLKESMGSIRFYEDHCQGIDFAAVLIMDLIGHDVETGVPAIDLAVPQVRDLTFIMGAESHPSLPGVVERAAQLTSDLTIMPTLNSYVGDMSDHHAFRLGGEPFLFLSCGQGRYYHHPMDTPEWVNFEKVHAVYELIMALTREIDQDRMPGPSIPTDTVDFEVRMFNQAFGPMSLLLLEKLGIEKLETRSDIDRLALVLRGALSHEREYQGRRFRRGFTVAMKQ